MSKTIQPIPFTPRPAKLTGPKIVREITQQRGEIDTMALGSRITPDQHAEKMAEITERARNRGR